jgi:hypothetical protein
MPSTMLSPSATLDRLTPPNTSERRIALIPVVITFATSIPALLLYDPVLNDITYITGAGADTRVLLGPFLELLLIIANVGSAVVLFPVLERQSEPLALGYVTARVVERAFIAVGILGVLAVVTLRQDLAGTGTDFAVGFGNGLLLGYLMYRSGLVPRGMAMLGLIGGPLICVSGVPVLFGAIEPGSVAQGIATIPEFLWDLSFGLT